MGLPVTWIELDQVERVREMLLALPERLSTRVPCKRAVELLAEEIRGLKGKGYSRKEIAEELSRHGVPVSETVLRSYLRGSGEKSKRVRPRGGGGKPRRDSSEDSAKAGAEARERVAGEQGGASGMAVAVVPPAAPARARRSECRE